MSVGSSGETEGRLSAGECASVGSPGDTEGHLSAGGPQPDQEEDADVGGRSDRSQAD